MKNEFSIHKMVDDIEIFLKNPQGLNSDELFEFMARLKDNLLLYIKNGIDFKTVIESLDDSILITDAKGKVIYVNPNYEVNTGILAHQLLDRTIEDIVEEGKLFTGGAVLDVIKTKKKAFRLSNVNITNPPKTGYVVGVPIFDDEGNLYQVVASSRPILSLTSLQQDFEQFLSAANALKRTKSNVGILSNADASELSSTMIGNSPQLQLVQETIKKAAPTDATILITGESGVGKEIVADEIYRMSNRSHNTFVKVNCASIPVNLLESELFGYEKGAFSGANSTGKQGLFEMANGGTLMLDEIGDMPLDLQAKLLRAIQSKEITRVGGTKSISLDIRFIAATNNDLKKKIADGSFRQDLYYRLNVIPVHISPLRERKGDIRLFCDYFIKEFTAKHKRSISLSESQLKKLESYNWPGNIRELENVIEYLTICSSGTNDIDSYLLESILDITNPNQTESTATTLSSAVENYEKKLISETLSTSKSLREAGDKLGVNASTISRKIKQYGINYKSVGIKP